MPNMAMCAIAGVPVSWYVHVSLSCVCVHVRVQPVCLTRILDPPSRTSSQHSRLPGSQGPFTTPKKVNQFTVQSCLRYNTECSLDMELTASVTTHGHFGLVLLMVSAVDGL